MRERHMNKLRFGCVSGEHKPYTRIICLTAVCLLLMLVSSSLYAREINKDHLQELFLRLLNQQLPWSPEDVMLVRFTVEPEKVEVPDGAKEIVRLKNPLRPGPNMLLVDYVYQGRLIRRVRLLGVVEVMLPVVVLKRPLERHAIVQAEDISLERRPLTRLPKDVILKPEDAVGLRTRMSLRAGRVLRTSSLEVPPVVKRGSLVRIVAEGENFVVSAVGEARQDGRPGEIIRVRNLSSKREVFGRVMDNKTVKVMF